MAVNWANCSTNLTDRYTLNRFVLQLKRLAM
jgi:hypothetical protein